ncbi:carbon monoxide dehydrogenase [Methanocella sp. CWC-04]|uniref:Carbon monoxide dehydrogenase n=2 Tax=Methanooceanicella nereidis TaxID=2052831 RepID=A0AAP2W672_9EURY|nr:carbon monoxide dehydrogenase [Methanocella sp. CWC-04]
MGHRVEPGLYSLGEPDNGSPVFVTANYTLSFDALRSSLSGISCYILVIDTRGINVWCAAGKGTFGTEELIRRIGVTGLAGVVSHRKLILPQLGAPGVAAFEVRKRSGFQVEYGPVRAADIPEYMKGHKATKEMRNVRFSLADRLVLVPVEVNHLLLPMIIAAIAAYLAGGITFAGALVSAMLAGVVLFPALLPWLPTKDFSTKGLILGLLVWIPFGWLALNDASILQLWQRGAYVLVYLLAMPAITSYLALNFTGSTPFTSRTGVKREISTYIPVMAGMVTISVIIVVILVFVKLMGWS